MTLNHLDIEKIDKENLNRKDYVFFIMKEYLSKSKDKKERVTVIIDNIIHLDIGFTYTELLDLTNENIDVKYGLGIKKEKKIPYLFIKETPFLLQRKSYNKKIDELLDKYEINKQFKFSTFFQNLDYKSLTENIFTIFKILFCCLFFEIIFFVFDLSHYTYYFYALLFFSFSFYLSGIGLKITVLFSSLFLIIKYLFSSYLSFKYHEGIIFDLNILFILSLVIFTLFILEIFYGITYFIIGAITIFYTSYRIMIVNKKILILVLNILATILIFYLYSIIPYPIFKFMLISSFFVIVLSITFFSGIYIIDNDKSNHYKHLYFMLKDFWLVSVVFKLFKNINRYLSKLHQNTDFMAGYSISKLTKNMKTVLVIFTSIWIIKICGLYSYFNSYEYEKNFFYDNSNYCSNLDRNDKILKTDNYNNVLFLTSELDNKLYLEKTITKSYTPDFIYLTLKIIQSVFRFDIINKNIEEFLLDDKKNLYYVYNIECNHTNTK